MEVEYAGIADALSKVKNRIEEAKDRRPKNFEHDVILIGVSKTKPKELVIEAYEHGCRHFGENYVNEIFEKSNDAEVLSKCPEIKWHFIGHLQSNKVSKLVQGCPNLYMIECVDSIKLADSINRAWMKTPPSHPLKIMIQVNTSQEESKSGIDLESVDNLVSHVLSLCPHLELTGLMTIGALNHSLDLGVNPDYQELVKCRDRMNKQFALKLQLSMGMSGDFEHAIELGSNFIRVGEKIFGPRKAKNVE